MPPSISSQTDNINKNDNKLIFVILIILISMMFFGVKYLLDINFFENEEFQYGRFERLSSYEGMVDDSYITTNGNAHLELIYTDDKSNIYPSTFSRVNSTIIFYNKNITCDIESIKRDNFGYKYNVYPQEKLILDLKCDSKFERYEILTGKFKIVHYREVPTSQYKTKIQYIDEDEIKFKFRVK